MENNFLSIDTDIDKFDSTVTINKKHDYKWVALIVLGIVMFYLQSVVDPGNGAPTMALFVLGFVLVIWGLVKTFSQVVEYKKGNSELKLSDIDFDYDRTSYVLEVCENEEFNKLKDVSNKSNSHVKLRILHDKDFEDVYIQNFRFSDYKYVPCNQIKLLNEIGCKQISDLLATRKIK